MTTSLTLALSKGRILEQSLPLLAKIGIYPLEDLATSRKLILETNHPELKLVLLRATDVPTYVQYGAAAVGVTGKDILLEHGGEELYEPLDLRIARCRLMVAGRTDSRQDKDRLRIATKYVNITRRYFATQGRQVELIKLYGSMELAPLVGLADRIVDLVDTGNTLRANGLEPLEHIADINSRLIVNKAAMKLQATLIKQLIARLAVAVEQASLPTLLP